MAPRKGSTVTFTLNCPPAGTGLYRQVLKQAGRQLAAEAVQGRMIVAVRMLPKTRTTGARARKTVGKRTAARRTAAKSTAPKKR